MNGSKDTKKTIAVLGATGSVGTQALDVARVRGYEVDVITAGTRSAEAEAICRQFHPEIAAMADEKAAADLAVRLADTNVRVLSGEKGIEEAIRRSKAQTVVNSILGEAGLLPTLAVIDSGKRLALANKESLVIAGEIVTARAKAANVPILPVDSEHCAVFQCLRAGKPSEVSRILLTASGGPFFGYTKERLATVTLKETLAHPTWKMGRKITVDSATLMNKGFEVLEAMHLFGVPSDRICVTVHRESIIHSAVEYIDHTVIAQMGVPDMRSCVQFAVDYPNREAGVCERLDLFSVGKLTFDKPDEEAFPLLALAKRAGKMGGGMGAVLNAADEVAVDAFLHERIPFIRISDIVGETFERMTDRRRCTLPEEILATDRDARAVAASLLP